MKYTRMTVPASDRFCRECDVKNAEKLHPTREAWLFISRVSIQYCCKESLTSPCEELYWDTTAAAVCTRDSHVSSIVCAAFESTMKANASDSESETRLKKQDREVLGGAHP